MNVSLHDISPSIWHYSSNSLEYYILVSHEPKLVWYFTIILAPFNQNSLEYYMLASYEHKLVWYFTIILAPFIQNSLGYYKLEYNANVSEAEESNRLQANFLLHQSRESRTLFSSAIRQAIDRSLQSGNICTLSTSGDHPTACISMIVSCQVMA